MLQSIKLSNNTETRYILSIDRNRFNFIIIFIKIMAFFFAWKICRTILNCTYRAWNYHRQWRNNCRKLYEDTLYFTQQATRHEKKTNLRNQHVCKLVINSNIIMCKLTSKNKIDRTKIIYFTETNAKVRGVPGKMYVPSSWYNTADSLYIVAAGHGLRL